MNDRALAGSVTAEFKGRGRVRFDYDLTRLGNSSLKCDHELARFACWLSTEPVPDGVTRVCDYFRIMTAVP